MKVSDENQDKKFEALATWYRCNKDGTLSPIQTNNHFFIETKAYLATVNNLFGKKELKFNTRDLSDVKSSLVKYFIQSI